MAGYFVNPALTVPPKKVYGQPLPEMDPVALNKKQAAVNIDTAQSNAASTQADVPAPVLNAPKPVAPPPATTPTNTNTATTTPARTTPYNPAAGWDVTKLNDPAQGTGTKYNFGRAAQDYTGGYGRGNLQGLIDYYNQTYGGHAKAVGDDHVDFGEEYGPIDIFNANGDYLQWVADSDPRAAAAGGGTAADSLGGANGAIAALQKQLLAQMALQNGQQPVGGGPSSVTPQWLTDPNWMLGEGGLAPSSYRMNPTVAEGFANLIKFQQDRLDRGQNRGLAMESARMPYEMARRTQLNNAQADLANRGLLSEPGHLQGGEFDSVRRIEEGLAPAYTRAIADAIGQQDAADSTNIQNLITTLTNSGTLDVSQADQLRLWEQLGLDTTKVHGELALKNLEQNRIWQQFVAQLGLDRDTLNKDIAEGHVDDYLKLLELWLAGAKISAEGFI